MAAQAPALSGTRPVPSRPARRRAGLVLLFLGPFVLLTVVFFVIPAVLTGLLGLTDLDAAFPGQVVGLENFRGFAADPLLPRGLPNPVVSGLFSLMCFHVG